MKNSPFIYGTTVSTGAFTNREHEVDRLMKNLMSGINTTIISPRRWGKSSLVEKVVAEINKKEKNTKTVVIDLFGVGGTEEFLEIFAREVIKASTTKWQEWMNTGKDFFKRLIPKLSIGVDPFNDFRLSFDWNELEKYSDEILNLPENIANSRNVKFIICLDEFQNLSNFSNYEVFEKKLRAAWQRQKNVTYCLYGSKRHMMTEIFNNPSKPFYRFGDIMLLGRIETRKWVSFIMQKFKSTGKNISESTANVIPAVMKNHSWYVQQLSHYVWNLTQKRATMEEVNAALEELINANSPLYQREVEILSSTQLNLLKAVASGETRLTAASTMQKYMLGTPRNVSKNKRILINNDVIQDGDENYEFVDPAFELWFRDQFFNQSYKIRN